MHQTDLPVHPTRAAISLSAFRHNLDTVRSYVVSGVRIMAVVKADAYGHGMEALASEAVRCGVAALGVARVGEGIQLRKQGVANPVLVFELAPPSLVEQAIAEDLQLTVSSREGAEEINASAERLRRKAKVQIKVDTGMGRLGFDDTCAAESVEQIARLKSIEITGIYSHFATSDNSDQSFAHEQLSRFSAVLEDLQRRHVEIPLRHMANSGAILSMPQAHLDMVRPGIMLYGYPPRRGLNADLKPVLTLVSSVTFIKNVHAGTSISYGRRFVARKATSIATVAIGYGDGFPRSLTNDADVLIRGKRFPSVGTICMDHLMVDVGKGGAVAVGDEVTLIGTDGGECITAWDLASKLGTIPYEITCLLSPRIPRIIVE
jgi:alanine racemase